MRLYCLNATGTHAGALGRHVAMSPTCYITCPSLEALSLLEARPVARRVRNPSTLRPKCCNRGGTPKVCLPVGSSAPSDKSPDSPSRWHSSVCVNSWNKLPSYSSLSLRPLGLSAGILAYLLISNPSSSSVSKSHGNTTPSPISIPKLIESALLDTLLPESVTHFSPIVEIDQCRLIPKIYRELGR
ncbi:hypothetical protein P171DRAFT_38110 [Karstenula rhodostoma CBS 690.94]|uniref:Uncharacterized protein n=1 Tax=Karstenula rhodostoma CBS 690.94 TaxID=1392251 RepID=A0A9P4UBM5_9PLEO|nr:hypothetical protein P171DRAFT_38110 [Karstenula rhodostoma CBS 690.94]